MKKNKINGTSIYLRPINLKDVGDDYLGWMQDPEVMRFVEARHVKYTKKIIYSYVRDILKRKREKLFAICLKDSDRYIGNIKIGPINSYHGFAYVGILIGEKDCWGRGIATEAISLITNYAFQDLNLHKLMAGCYATNKGSARAFENAGFKKEGLTKDTWWDNGKYVDGIIMGKLNPNQRNRVSLVSINWKK